MSPAARFAPDPEQIAAFLRSANQQLSGPSMIPPVGSEVSVQALSTGVRHGGQAAACRAVFGDRAAALRLTPAARRPSSDDSDARRQQLMLDLVGIRERHPDEMRGVVKTYAAFTADVGAVGGGLQATAPMFALVQEYGEESLADHLRKRGRLAPRQAVELILPVLRALAYLHRRSPAIVHRDIAPDNILLREDGSLFLIDFGVATIGDRQLADVTTKFWKNGRIAPEVARADRRMHVSPKLDVWQAGRVLHDMLIGLDAEPFKAGIYAPPDHPRLAGLPAPVRSVVKAMLAPEQKARPSMRNAADQLSRWLNPPEPKPKKVAPVHPDESDKIIELRRRLRTRSRALGVAVSVLVLAAVAGTALVASNKVDVQVTPSGRDFFGLDPVPGTTTTSLPKASQVAIPGDTTLAEFLTSFDNLKGSDSVGSITSLPLALKATRYGRVAEVSPVSVSTSDPLFQTLSYGCTRTQTSSGDGSDQGIAPGPYLVVGHKPASSSLSWSDSGYWSRGATTSSPADDVSLLGAACRYPDGSLTATSWPRVGVGSRAPWHASSGTGLRTVAFQVPDAAGRVAGTPYPYKIYGLVWISDTGRIFYGPVST